MAGTALTIRLTRRRDDAVVFELRRADGTTTWQKRMGPTAEFFAVHDLTHYAVETELGFRRAFYGLVAEGWDLSDFGSAAGTRCRGGDAGARLRAATVSA